MVCSRVCLASPQNAVTVGHRSRDRHLLFAQHLTLMPCSLCANLGLRFCRGYSPAEFVVGDPYSEVWVIGLNPKSGDRINDLETPEKLHAYFSDGGTVHPYFRDIRSVSEHLHGMLGKKNGVAHTDLVKCHSSKWPPAGRKNGNEIVQNCSGYLKEQIRKYQPRILFCNGVDVCRFIREALPVEEDHETYYRAVVGDRDVFVVLSGFVGRIDNYSRRRLGVEIERLLTECRRH
jgi:hypothetical protein